MGEHTGKLVIYSRKRTAILHLLVGLFSLLVGIPATVEGVYSPNFMFGVLFSVLAVVCLYRSISLSVWKCTVEGEHITYRSLFRRRAITFSDIKSVVPKNWRNRGRYGGVNDSFVGIDLHSETRKLFHIHGSKVGFRAFVTSLEERGIPGAEQLPKGIQWR